MSAKGHVPHMTALQLVECKTQAFMGRKMFLEVQDLHCS